MIVRGHKRREAALRVGLDKVPIKRVKDGDTDKQQRWMNSREVEGYSLGYMAWAYTTAVINDNQEKQYTISEVKKMSRDQRKKLLNCKRLILNFKIIFSIFLCNKLLGTST